MSAARTSTPTAPPNDHLITARQREILSLAAQGLTDREVGEQLRLAVSTVKGTLAAARKRLGARNTVHAVALALSLDLVALDEHEASQGPDIHAAAG